MNKKELIGFAFGPIIGAVLGIIIVPITAWIFPPDDVGRLNILQVAISFSLLFFVLGLDQAYVREYHESNNRSQLLLTCFIPGFIFLLISCAVGIFFADDLSYWLFDRQNEWYIYLMLFCFILEYLNRFLSLILRMREQGWAYSVSSVAPKIVQVFMMFGLLFTTTNKEFLVLIMVILGSQLTMLIIFLYHTRIDFLMAAQCRINKYELCRLLQFGFPLIFSGVAYWGLVATSTFALRSWANLEDLAIYSVANSFSAAAGIFQSIFTVIWAPTVFKWASQGDVNADAIYKIARQALAIICVIISIGGTFSWLIDFILPEPYLNVKYIFICLMLQPLLYTLSEITSIGIGIKRRPIYLLWATSLALLTNLILCLLTVPKFGASGAAVSNAIAFTVFFIGRTEISARSWKRFPLGKIYSMVILLLIASIAMVLYQNIASLIIHCTWAFLFILTLFVFKVEILGFALLILNKKKLSQLPNHL